MTRTKLMTMLPPVASAATSRITRNKTNHGDNAAPMPQITWRTTAQIRGFLRPNLSDKYPKRQLPKRMPNMVTVWARLAK